MPNTWERVLLEGWVGGLSNKGNAFFVRRPKLNYVGVPSCQRNNVMFDSE